MPEDGNRYEAFGGELCASPPPKPPHQWVIANLFQELSDLLARPRLGRLFCAPIGVEFSDTQEGVQPDMLFVSNERLRIVTEDAIRGAPDLVIEVLSPRTVRRDRTVKRRLYRRQGIAEYCVVELDARQVEVCVLRPVCGSLSGTLRSFPYGCVAARSARSCSPGSSTGRADAGWSGFSSLAVARPPPRAPARWCTPPFARAPSSP